MGTHLTKQRSRRKTFDEIVEDKCNETVNAIKTGDYKTAGSLLKHSLITSRLRDYQDKDGYNVLQVCALRGNADILHKLITLHDYPPDAIGSNKKLYTALQLAAERGYCRLIHILAQAGAKLDRFSDQEPKFWSPLHLACYAGKVEAVEQLLKLGSQIHALSPLGGTILHTIVKGHWSLCTRTTSYSENIDCNHYYAAKAVISFAAERGLKVRDIGFWAPNRPPLLHYCLEYDLYNLLQLFVENGAVLTERDSDGETVLHRAAWTNNEQIVNCLSFYKEILDEKDGKGYTPLHNAIQQNHTLVCRRLICSGADTQVRISHFKHAGLVMFLYSQHVRGVHDLSAMEMAIVLGHAKVLSIMVQHRIDSQVIATIDEVQALSIAWQYMKDKSRFLDCIKILFYLPGFLSISDINKPIEGTRKPMLHMAVAQHRFDIIKDLCSNPNINLDSVDMDGKTVVQSLFVVCDPFLEQHHELYLQKLIKYGASPNVLVSAGTLTPLIWAIRIANCPMVKLLIHAGSHVDQEIKVSRGVVFTPRTALSACIRFDYGSCRMLRMVLAADCSVASFWHNKQLQGTASPEMETLLLQKATTIYSLRQISRKHIRSSLRHSKFIEQLPLPRLLKEYLYIPELQYL